jgi:hypothetical protein
MQPAIEIFYHGGARPSGTEQPMNPDFIEEEPKQKRKGRRGCPQAASLSYGSYIIMRAISESRES